jgi:hypothetical protein
MQGVSGLSLRTPKFDHGPIRVKFVVGNVDRSSPCTSVFRCQYHSAIATYSIVLLSEGQAGEAWEPSNKGMLFRMLGNIGKTGLRYKVLSPWFQ